MAYLQCKEGKPQDHSFIYMRKDDSSWGFVGNGFLLEKSAMPAEKFSALLTAAEAQTTCKQANVMVNVFGTDLEECRTNPADMSGSWQDDGKCTEQIGGVHEICIEKLPADFSEETHQPPWSRGRADQRHCVCVGAWSLYMTDERKHPDQAQAIMPHCKAIPETALTKKYLENWNNWNGYSANIVKGVGELVKRCLQDASPSEQCGLKKRYKALRSDVKELDDNSLDALDEKLNGLVCP
jgi:hypothetical protein